MNEPIPDKIWVHMTCAYWIPEIFFDDLKNYSKINSFFFLLL